MQAALTDLTTLLLSNFTVTLFVLGLITAGFGMLRARRHGRLTASVVWGRLLDHFLLLSVGVSYLYNFVMHSVFGDFTAEVIGWDQSPFQLEVAFASLGFAAVGFLGFPRRQGWMVKLAALLGPEAGVARPEERTQLPVVYGGDPVAELVADGGADRAFLERVAVLISPYCLVGWDTGGVPWDPAA